MTPEKAARILRGVLMSLRMFEEEAEIINEVHPGAALHLLASLRQARQSLTQLIERE